MQNKNVLFRINVRRKLIRRGEIPRKGGVIFNFTIGILGAWYRPTWDQDLYLTEKYSSSYIDH